MPGKRSFSQFSQSQSQRTKFRYARRRSVKRRARKPTLATKLNKLARDLKPEVKFIASVNNAGAGNGDSFAMWNTSTTAGYYLQTYPINSIPEGDDQGGRTGRKVRYTGGTIKGTLLQQSSCTGLMRVKLYVFIYKKYNPSDWGTSPWVVSDQYGRFLDGDPLSGFPGYSSFRNTDFKKDYAVLKCINLFVPADNYSGQARRLPFSFSYKIPQKYSLGEYKGAANSDLTNPAIYVMAVAHNGLTSNNTGLQLVFQSRVYYTDL